MEGEGVDLLLMLGYTERLCGKFEFLFFFALLVYEREAKFEIVVFKRCDKGP